MAARRSSSSGSLLIALIVVGIIGLVVGYFIFARYPRGGAIPLGIVLGTSSTFGEKMAAVATSVVVDLSAIRRDIIASGIVGAIVGVFLNIFMRRSR